MVGKTNGAVNSKCSPALELSLKRPLDSEDTDTSSHKRNILKQSDLSAFSRYSNITSIANQALTTNVGSCSPPDVTISSEAANAVCIQSNNSNGSPNQRSNGSSVPNNDMGSSTNNGLDGKPNPPGLCDGPSRNIVSNGLTEGNAANDGSASGSNNSDGENGNSGDNVVTEKGKDGNLSGSGSRVDQDRFAYREAALSKFRQKRKERCFEKKIPEQENAGGTQTVCSWAIC